MHGGVQEHAHDFAPKPRPVLIAKCIWFRPSYGTHPYLSEHELSGPCIRLR